MKETQLLLGRTQVKTSIVRYRIVKPGRVVVNTAAYMVVEGDVSSMAAVRRIKVAGGVYGTEAVRLVNGPAVKRRRKVVKLGCAVSMEVTKSAKRLNAARRMREEVFVSLTVVRSAAVSQGARVPRK